MDLFLFFSVFRFETIENYRKRGDYPNFGAYLPDEA